MPDPSHHAPTPSAGLPFPWAAPPCSAPLTACIRLPGSKSATARALYVAAVADRPTEIRGALASRDTSLMMDALRALGADCAQSTDGAIRVTPITSWSQGDITIDVGLAGTVMRFVPLLAALRPGTTRFVGDAEASSRPVGPVLDVARALGAQVVEHGEPGRVPFSVSGLPPHATAPTTLTVDAAASSQFLSATLLVAPLLGRKDGLPRVVRSSGPVVSLPHVQMTCEVLRDRGITVEEPQVGTWVVHPGTPAGGMISIEPDLTNAGVFMAATMLCGGELTIPHWPSWTTQAGDAWRDFFTSCGAQVSLDAHGLHMSVPATAEAAPTFPGVDADFSDLGELTPTAVAVALFADTPSRIRGVAHIRGHETDRLAALAAEIRALGGHVHEHHDGLDITPTRELHPANLRSYADHRMATFAALVGLRVPGVTVDDIGATSKTLPGFTHLWGQLLTQPANIPPTESPCLQPHPGPPVAGGVVEVGHCEAPHAQLSAEGAL